MADAPNFQNTVAVIGNGWSAISSVALALGRGWNVHWILGTRTHLYSPLPVLEREAVDAAIAAGLGTFFDPESEGSSLRESCHHGFRLPKWTAIALDARGEAVLDELSEPESRLIALDEVVVRDWERQLRAWLEAEVESNDRLVVTSTVLSGAVVSDGVLELTLGNGSSVAASKVIFADRWDTLRNVEGVPVGFSREVAREWGSTAAVQVVFDHDPVVEEPIRESFILHAPRDKGDTVGKRAYGHFFAKNSKSVWTLFLDAAEAEDNHEVTKRIRLIRRTMDRCFQFADWISSEGAFSKTIVDEAVLFEDSALVHGRVPEKPLTLTELPGLKLIGDGFGASHAIRFAVVATNDLEQISGKAAESEAATPERTHEEEAPLSS